MPLGRVGPRVQGADRHLLRRVRARGSGVVSVSTKSGNNEWHGTAFEYLRNEEFDAKNFFALPTAKKAPLDRHQYGAQLSGPIIKNKTFFMVDFAGLNEKRGITTVNTVPTAATRAGDFSDYRDRSGNLIPIYDPLTTRPNPNGSGFVRGPFPGNVIPADRLNQVGLNVASIYPLPNGPGNFDNYTSTTNREVKDTAFTVRIDHRRGGPRQLLRPLQLRQVQPRRPAGPGRVLPAHPARSREPLRPRALRGRHPEHPAHRPRRRVQLDAHLRAVGGERAAPRLREDEPARPAVGLRHAGGDEPGHPGHQRHRVHHGPAEPQHPGPDRDLGRPAFLPVNPKQTHYQIEDTVSWVRGRHAFKGGYRFVLRQPSPFTNTDTRSSISINRNLTNNPRPTARARASRRCCSATRRAAPAASCSSRTT